MTNKVHILAVDDEPQVAHVLERLLLRLGYQVSMFTSATEALAAFTLRPEDYQLLITDEEMPVMKGHELVASARLLRPDLKVLVVSGSALHSTMLSERHLAKPYSLVALGEAIGQVLISSPPADPRELLL